LLAALTELKNDAINPISFGHGIAASCAVVSAATTFGSASFSATASSTAYSLISPIPSSPINSVKS
jgi:hypothetical protein